MRVDSIELFQFRNHQSRSIQFDGPFTLFHGQNGAGKTNILEALSLLSIGGGFRKARLEELGRYQGEKFLPWSLHGKVRRRELSFEIETKYNAEKNKLRDVLIDSKKQPQKELANYIRYVILTPTMDKVFTEGHQSLRRLIDKMIAVFDPAHADRLSKYKALYRERQALCEKEGCRTWMNVNAKILAEYGVSIAIARLDYIERLNQILHNQQTHFPKIRLGCRGKLETALQTSVALEVEERYSDYLQKHHFAPSIDGAHRSQFELIHRVKNLPANLCSTGEQKTMLLALLLGQMELLEKMMGEPPVFLLDEGSAHLDSKNQDILLAELVRLKAQTILTNVDAGIFKSQKVQRIHIDETD